MSNKSAKKPAKKLSVPREMAAIESDYRQLAAEAGQKQYQLLIGQEELKGLNDRIRQINNEGAARKQLDQEAAARLQEATAQVPPQEEHTPASGAV